jgi:hypothetical protein
VLIIFKSVCIVNVKIPALCCVLFAPSCILLALCCLPFALLLCIFCTLMTTVCTLFVYCFYCNVYCLHSVEHCFALRSIFLHYFCVLFALFLCIIYTLLYTVCAVLCTYNKCPWTELRSLAPLLNFVFGKCYVWDIQIWLYLFISQSRRCSDGLVFSLLLKVFWFLTGNRKQDSVFMAFSSWRTDYLRFPLSETDIRFRFAFYINIFNNATDFRKHCND